MGRQKSSSIKSGTQESKRNHDIKKEKLPILYDDKSPEIEIREHESEQMICDGKQSKRLQKQSANKSADRDQDSEETIPSPGLNKGERDLETKRPKRKATNAHFFRYLQTRNPSRLEEEDLKRALEASLEECPDYWPEDSASCSSSDQSNAPSSSAGSSTGGRNKSIGPCNGKNCKYNRSIRRRSSSLACCSRLSSASSQHCPHSTMQHNSANQCNQHCHHHSHSYQSTHHPATNCHCHGGHHHHPPHQSCPNASVHRRYKPVAKKNIYDEADFFHDGIMEYIEYELMKHEGLLKGI